MERKISNQSENSIYYGKNDYEEDEDAYGPFVLPNKQREIKPISQRNAIESNIDFNGRKFSDSLTTTNKTKKEKKKTKETNDFNNLISQKNVSMEKKDGLNFAEVKNEADEKSIKSTKYHRENNVDNIIIDNKSKIEELIKDKSIINVPIVTSESIFIPNSPQILPQHNTIYSQLVNPMLIRQPNNQSFNINQRFVHQNPYFFMNNLHLLSNSNSPRLESPPSSGEHVPNLNYSLTTTYNQRLQIVDYLFRFIMQLLRTPEQPPLQQINHIKQMLDSLIVSRPQQQQQQ